MTNAEQKRSYHSPRRQEQAQATRQRISEAAFRLFAAHGYVATTLPAIAREAGVAPATVTAVFGTKFGILDALIRTLVRGDDAPQPLAERPWWQEMLREPDPVSLLRHYAATATRLRERTATIAEIVRGAATADPEIAALRHRLNESRLADMRIVAEALARKGARAPGVTVERATDLLWAIDSAEMYQALVGERGWSPEEYGAWLEPTLIYALLGQAGP